MNFPVVLKFLGKTADGANFTFTNESGEVFLVRISNKAQKPDELLNYLNNLKPNATYLIDGLFYTEPTTNKTIIYATSIKEYEQEFENKNFRLEEYSERAKIDVEKAKQIEEIRSKTMISLNASNNATILCQELIKNAHNLQEKVEIIQKCFPIFYELIVNTVNKHMLTNTPNLEEIADISKRITVPRKSFEKPTEKSFNKK